jgi:hypothetical protein
MAAVSVRMLCPSTRPTLSRPCWSRPASRKRGDRSCRLQVVVVKGLRVVVGHRHAEVHEIATKLLSLQPRLAGHLRQGVAIVGGEHALDRQRRDAVLGHRHAELLERDAVAGESLQELAALFPLVTVDAVQHPLGGPVDAGRAPEEGSARRAGATPCRPRQ